MTNPFPPDHGAGNTMSANCPGCMSPLEYPGMRFCLVCGYELVPQPHSVAACASCASPIPPGAAACDVCGYPASATAPPPTLSEEGAGQAATHAEKTSAKTAALVCSSEDGQKETYALKIPVTRIGRHAENDVSFPSERAISGRHCEIFLQDDAYFIRDLGSTNGVLLNGERVESGTLADGDKVKLGFKTFRFTQE